MRTSLWLLVCLGSVVAQPRLGAPAPDFEATDADGKRFRLSDYRGRVVVLDFWGFW